MTHPTIPRRRGQRGPDKAPRKPRVVRIPSMTDEQLANFATPLSWPQILAIDPTKAALWWTDAVIEADEYGRGLIRWDKVTNTWVLTEVGYERVCSVLH